MEVKRISGKDTLVLRQQMLRPGKELSDCVFSGDSDEQSFHLGAFVDKKLVSVASFYLDSNPAFPDEFQYRLRGMATLPEFQKRGFSQALLKTAFPIIKQNMCKILWCNARVSALGFYEKVGFTIESQEFEIPGIGPHVLMKKIIE
jgi:GNAT superfamily N-acetyltransferase